MKTRFVYEWVEVDENIEVDENNCITQDCPDMMNKAIENYNKGIVSEPVDLGENK